MDNFKFNFLWLGLLTFIQNITMPRGFFGDLIFANIARMLCGNHLIFFSFLVMGWGIKDHPLALQRKDMFIFHFPLLFAFQFFFLPFFHINHL